ncbi:MAG: hypothetical protein AB2L20_30060 [Mangrovibacterium sp.]
MKLLNTDFRKNGMEYRIIKRSQTRYIAEIDGRWLETGRIIVKKPRTVSFEGRQVVLKERESIPDNEHFGKDPARCEKCMRVNNREKIEAYFDQGNTCDFLRSPKAANPKVVHTIHQDHLAQPSAKKRVYAPEAL